MLRKKSIMKEWMISYTLILLIPLITIFINYGYNARVIRKEIIQAHELILYNLRDNIDRLMDEEREMFWSFYSNERFKNLVGSQVMDGNFIYDAHIFKGELASYAGGNNHVSYWLYMEQKDYIINSSGAHQSLNIYNGQKLQRPDMPEYEVWMEFLKEDYSNEFIFYDGLSSTKIGTNLIYANSYSGYNTGTVNIFISISVSDIENLVTPLPMGSLFCIYLDRQCDNSEEQFLVIDSEGIAKLPENITMYDLCENNRNFEVGDYIGISVRSDNENAAYYLLVPRETFWEESGHIRNVHLISLFTTLVLGVCMVFFFVKRNFRPVSSILAVMGNNTGEGNEFDQIKNAHGMMMKENATMKKMIESQEKRMISSYLLSLLKGRVTKIGDREQQIGLGLLLQSGLYALMGFYIPLKEDESMEYDELSFFVVDNILSELMEGEIFYQIEDGRFVYYLFCIPSGREDAWKEKSLKHANFLCDLLEEKFGLQPIVVISALEEDISQAKHMYQSVMEAFEYKKIIGGSGVITTEEQRDPDENNQLHVCYVMLEHALEKGILDEAYLASGRLFLDSGQIPSIVLRLRVLEAFQVVVDCYNKYIVDSVKRMQLLSWMEQLLNAENPEDMKRQFEGMLAFACAKIGGQWEAESKSLVKCVKEYVENNYADSNLNISSIAAQMNRNPKYVSKIFKEETGEGILDYINILRIRKAQEILLTKSISVEEVSVMVGYASTRTFRRSFTKIVGVTPSGYLENN